jgi:O-antigen/teichoic acid export membrane protein
MRAQAISSRVATHRTLHGPYIYPLLGSASTSAAHFVASLLLLHRLPASEFGLFAFVLVIVFFGCGFSNALAATPFTLAATKSSYQPDDGLVFFKVNSLVSAACGITCFGIGWAMNAGYSAWLIGVFAGLSVLRWFSRSSFYALRKPMKAALSDAIYSAVLIIGLIIAWSADLTLQSASIAYMTAAIAGVIACGEVGLYEHFRGLISGNLRLFMPIWREQARWALLGVVATEATANTHVYLVSLVAGPAAFAPLAAAALFFRPLGICVNALTQIERPGMARAIAAGNSLEALTALHRFRLLAMLTWIGTVVIIMILLGTFPELIMKSGYESSVVYSAVGIWAVIVGMNTWRAADSTLIQAANRLAPLAMANLWASMVSVAASSAFLWVAGPVASLAGVMLGQAVMAWLIGILLINWRREHA